jgi:hypothetical protein
MNVNPHAITESLARAKYGQIVNLVTPLTVIDGTWIYSRAQLERKRIEGPKVYPMADRKHKERAARVK